MFNISIIAVGLGLDAFSLAVAFGMCHHVCTLDMKFRLAFSFGFFQFFMPLAGFFAGMQVAGLVETFDHWLVLAVLGSVGVKMVWDALSKEDNIPPVDFSRGLPLLLASVATSTDALAVGFSLALISDQIILPALIIGIVASLMTLLGVELGNRVGRRFISRPELVGGLAIMVVGVKIFVEGIMR